MPGSTLAAYYFCGFDGDTEYCKINRILVSGRIKFYFPVIYSFHCKRSIDTQ